MKEEQQSNLNFLQIYTAGSINVEEILQMFIKKTQEDCFHHLFLVKQKGLCNFSVSVDLLHWKYEFFKKGRAISVV